MSKFIRVGDMVLNIDKIQAVYEHVTRTYYNGNCEKEYCIVLEDKTICPHISPIDYHKLLNEIVQGEDEE